MAKPKLLKYAKRHGSAPYELALECFGEIATEASLDLPVDPPDNLLRALTAEFLMTPKSTPASSQLKSYLENVEQAGRDLGIFGLEKSELKLADVSGMTISCAIFPISIERDLEKPEKNGNSQKSTLGRIWCLFHPRGKLPTLPGIQLDGADALSVFPNKIFIAETNPDPRTPTIAGKSWRAAAYLAEQSASNEVSPETRLKLARDFIISADVNPDNTNLLPVACGNKLNVVQNNKKRTWIIAEGSTDFTAQFKAWNGSAPPPCQEHQSIRTAFREIAGYSIQPGEQVAWPANIAEMHILVGGSIASALVSAVLTKPEKLHLWHSRNESESILPANTIKALLTRFNILNEEHIILHRINSNDVADVEKEIRDQLPASADTPVLFNVTSGNRLMMFAVDRISHDENRKIEMIYRDLNGSGLDFTRIKHIGGRVTTSICAPLFDFTKRNPTLINILNMRGSEETQFQNELTAWKEEHTTRNKPPPVPTASRSSEAVPHPPLLSPATPD